MASQIQSAVDNGRLAGVVTLAADLSGKVNVERAYGVKTLNHESGTNPLLTVDTPMRTASCTKLLTAILTLQAYERGELTLEDTAGDRVPELAAMKVIKGFDGAGEPVLEEPKSKITLAQLLTHSWGGTYSAFSPDLIKWATARGMPVDGSAATVATNFNTPLIFHPGEGWQYGSGCDWAGKYVEAAAGKPLEELLQAGICSPLGIDITFKLQSRPDMLAKRADMSERVPETGKVQYIDRGYFHKDPEEAFGGQGAFMSPLAFFAVLRSILANDGKLLKPATRDLLFTDMLGPVPKQRLADQATLLAAWKPHGPVDPAAPKSWALGGLLFTGDSVDGRRAGSISWSGMPNHFWTIDPAAGLAWLTSFHMEPWGDDLCFELCRNFEKDVYAQL